MSAKNCPFTIIKKTKDDSEGERTKSRYASVDVKADPNNPNSITINHQFEKLNNTDEEDVLYFMLRAQNMFKRLGLTNADSRSKFNLTENFLEGTPLEDWIAAKTEVEEEDLNTDVYTRYYDVGKRWVSKYMSDKIRIDTKEWLNCQRKPRTWTVQQYIERVIHLNNLIPQMPEPENWDSVIDKFGEHELMTIIRKSGPSSWAKKEIESGIELKSLKDQARYYQGIKNIEDSEENSRNRRSAKRNNDGSYRRNTEGSGGNQSSSRNGNNQIQNNYRRRDYNSTNNGNQRQRIGYQGRHFDPNFYINGRHHNRNNNNQNNYNGQRSYNNGHGSNNNGNYGRSNNQNNRINQRGNNNNQYNQRGYNNNNYKNFNRNNYNNGPPRRDENNNINGNGYQENRIVPYDRNQQQQQQNNNNEWQPMNPQDENFEIWREEMFAINDEILAFEDSTDDELTADVGILILNKHNGTKKSVLGLLDSGARSVYVKKQALTGIPHKVRDIEVNAHGRYGSHTITQLARFEVQLPDFCTSRTVTVEALVEDSSTGRHDIVFGRKFLQELGITLDYGSGSMTWNGHEILMKKTSQVQAEINTVNAMDPKDNELPDFMKSSMNRMSKEIKANEYEKYNYKEMVTRCKHLTTEQQQILLALFENYKELFSGKLGKVPGPPVHITLKKEAKPYFAAAYTVPIAIEHLAKKEIFDLKEIGVLKEGVALSWLSPTMFRQKKDGKCRVVTDLRRLNENIERSPYPLPVIDDVLLRIGGWQYATCLDLNRGYYHFELDEYSQRLCGTTLPWGNYAYGRLPQGLKISSDVFQQRMVQIFGDMVDVIIYIDNIILFTKGDFNHHVNRLDLVMQRLQQNDLHVHVEKTFLASKKVDYLGYTLTPNGIKPQIEKIMPILRLAEPQNKKQLRSFIGMINFYRNMWHHRSHLLHPLTSLTSDKAKFTWGPEQSQAFKKLKQVISRNVLLNYPDFTKPFDIYPDSSDYQLGAVIMQDGNPVAFYSRKLTSAQRNYTIMEKELLSIVETMEKFRNILLGHKCRIYSDHKNLSFYHFHSERVRRWRLLLEEYDYTFRHIAGKDNVIADCLSRYPMIEIQPGDIEEMHTIEDEPFPFTLDLIHEHQQKDQFIQRHVLQKNYQLVQDGKYMIAKLNDKTVVPDSMIHALVSWYHENLNHPGITRTYLTINQHFHYRGLQSYVDKFVSKCTTCREAKRTAQKKYGHLLANTTEYEPWECLQVDLFGPWTFEDADGKTHKLQGVSIIDVTLKWIELHYYDTKKSYDVFKILDNEWLCRYPRPRFVIYDNGTEFGKEFYDGLLSYGITPKPTTIKNPQANAFIERVHLTIGDSIQAMKLDQRHFDDTSMHSIMQSIAWGLRSTYHTQLMTTPGNLTFGRDMIIHATYLANWHFLSQRKQKRILMDNRRENSKRIKYTHRPGTQVYVTDFDVKRKLERKTGPYTVTQVFTNGTIEIQRSPIVKEVLSIRRVHPLIS